MTASVGGCHVLHLSTTPNLTLRVALPAECTAFEPGAPACQRARRCAQATPSCAVEYGGDGHREQEAAESPAVAH